MEKLKNGKCTNRINDLTRREKILLEEYRNAQLSAQHHEIANWPVP